jgi:hypothetical protein
MGPEGELHQDEQKQHQDGNDEDRLHRRRSPFGAATARVRRIG